MSYIFRCLAFSSGKVSFLNFFAKFNLSLRQNKFFFRFTLVWMLRQANLLTRRLYQLVQRRIVYFGVFQCRKKIFLHMRDTML